MELFNFSFWATNSHKKIVHRKLVHWLPKSMYLNKLRSFQNYGKNIIYIIPTPPILLQKNSLKMLSLQIFLV